MNDKKIQYVQVMTPDGKFLLCKIASMMSHNLYESIGVYDSQRAVQLAEDQLTGRFGDLGNGGESILRVISQNRVEIQRILGVN